MHPKNLNILTASNIDVVCLANNHIADWGEIGVQDTLRALNNEHIHHAGAGSNRVEAQQAAVIPIPDSAFNQRLLVYSVGHESSGVPWSWQATDDHPGLEHIALDREAVLQLTDRISKDRKGRPIRDIAILSIHWGGNWGYDVSSSFTAFAHHLIDDAGVDIVFGHSSHHPQTIEIYKGKLIMYGAGDLLNDYEGIHDTGTTGEGMSKYRGDLSLMYFPSLDAATGKLLDLILVPQQITHFQLETPFHKDVDWLLDTLNQEYSKFGNHLKKRTDGSFELIFAAPDL
jgi:poly-gamma-glutamate capsule biosynthesis protein CapA/YwtB (metallophosphatase superfamily)